MFEIKVIKEPITKDELAKIAQEGFGHMVKAVIDTEQEIMAINGELHADEEVFLMENHQSKRKNTWGINLYPDKPKEEMAEYDSMVNIKPSYNNRSRNVESAETRKQIQEIVNKLII